MLSYRTTSAILVNTRHNQAINKLEPFGVLPKRPRHMTSPTRLAIVDVRSVLRVWRTGELSEKVIHITGRERKANSANASERNFNNSWLGTAAQPVLDEIR